MLAAIRSDPPEGTFDWKTHRLCEGVHPSIFFSLGRQKISIWARRLCMDCPVRVFCLQAGWREQYGIWGGILPEGRKTIREDLEIYLLSITELMAGFDAEIRDIYDEHYGWSIPDLLRRLQMMGDITRPEDDEEDV